MVKESAVKDDEFHVFYSSMYRIESTISSGRTAEGILTKEREFRQDVLWIFLLKTEIQMIQF